MKAEDEAARAFARSVTESLSARRLRVPQILAKAARDPESLTESERQEVLNAAIVEWATPRRRHRKPTWLTPPPGR